MAPQTLPIRLGCAGWSLPRQAQPHFPAAGSHLERYAARLNAVEINSSFYRPHQAKTYARWAASVPDDFRFSVKLPKAITHIKRLQGCSAELRAFIEQTSGLGAKLGCVLVQLPPSLGFAPRAAAAFLNQLRNLYTGALALEARHASWFDAQANALLQTHRSARVLADPVLFDAGRWPGGNTALVYARLHGSPRVYCSAYPPAVLDALATRLAMAASDGVEAWCMFDNTASGAAIGDALHTLQQLGA